MLLLLLLLMLRLLCRLTVPHYIAAERTADEHQSGDCRVDEQSVPGEELRKSSASFSVQFRTTTRDTMQALPTLTLVLSSLLIAGVGRRTVWALGSCQTSAGGPLCCTGRDSSCVVQKAAANTIVEDLHDEPCYCDHACLKLNDCCPDYRQTCRGKSAVGEPINKRLEIKIVGLSFHVPHRPPFTPFFVKKKEGMTGLLAVGYWPSRTRKHKKGGKKEEFYR